ncbi:MAG: VOC family protein [Woeseiaceae bacterium]|jgi:predicted enzyme related to lactoylglutathione lyase|nr:VOC family protein [Woeseiaceae bacterium]TFG40688.1 MAG: VOC family protein [Chromatiales bacterium]
MHKSRLAGFIVDCEGGNLDEAARFWGKALGYNPLALSDEEEKTYRGLDTGPKGLHIEVQRVDHASRVHLDIETDDIEAEVRRLEGLGAKRLGKVKSWCVMEAPTGHRFCVVRQQHDDFEESANVW